MKIEHKTQHLQTVKDSLSTIRFLLCVDLEATCDELPKGAPPDAKLTVEADQMETIEVGLVVLDLHTFNVVDEFQRFVRPLINPSLTAFCRSLTSIEQHHVDEAGTYREVAEEVAAFTARYPLAAWASWGDYDAKQIARDALFNECAPMLDGLEHHNAKEWYLKILDCRAMGLKPAVESMGLAWRGTYHRGIDDARNLVQVIKMLIS
ncbi:exonuclease domain-containing protein [Pseudomonas yamanorum]|uniref:3'-5' exonuclease n=1 Tax=Pseudomonas yamanorum TaxID=515393 RepID=UPI001C4702A3|nr:3'-5' exonuclease [Pseudomonas yamanorum]MBV6659801.1 exonuclease domain-containing protein [Pseudomonas yamanorum]